MARAGGSESRGEGLRHKVMVCAICGKPATCVGLYDAQGEDQDPEPACDDCCGHGNEDGWCVPIEDWKRKPELRLVSPVGSGP